MSRVSRTEWRVSASRTHIRFGFISCERSESVFNRVSFSCHFTRDSLYGFFHSFASRNTLRGEHVYAQHTGGCFGVLGVTKITARARAVLTQSCFRISSGTYAFPQRALCATMPTLAVRVLCFVRSSSRNKKLCHEKYSSCSVLPYSVSAGCSCSGIRPWEQSFSPV